MMMVTVAAMALLPLFLPPRGLCVVPSLGRYLCEAQLTEADLSELHGDRKE